MLRRQKKLARIGLSAVALVALLRSPLHAEETPVVKPAGKETKLTLGGLVQAQGEFGDAGDSRFPKDNRFLLRRARPMARGALPKASTSAWKWNWAGQALPCAAR